MKALLLQAVVASFASAGALLAYDRLVFRPAQRVGVVDIGEVYRRQEAEFTRILTHSTSEQERERAHAAARNFARRLPLALEELGRDCECLVLLRNVVAGRSPHTVDMTTELQKKMESP